MSIKGSSANVAPRGPKRGATKTTRIVPKTKPKANSAKKKMSQLSARASNQLLTGTVEAIDYQKSEADDSCERDRRTAKDLAQGVSLHQ
ncbi:hypothetical protein FSZ31_00240 [Sphingorhabdus soli]|uniref:Uncharacterized protein n=1 Tax=Flavisphingopyxis soli TaxID=2601267 RepID=A0A5C6UJV0_9SPHN|nr:hypothetical protein [Sphingorhabdus soli]TXC73233.1 hypothetical protein FSZ31_00240 [Sphingorhabdus soli]